MPKSPLMGQCSMCAASFEYELIHDGFNESAYAYCDRCGATAMLSGWSRDIPPEAELRLHQRIGPSVEPFLAPCACGGRFRAAAGPRCPACHEPLDADRVTGCIEANASGAARGWRWQHSDDPWLHHPGFPRPEV